MMASDHPLAHHRLPSLPSSDPATTPHVAKGARQVVPAFLQKLYEMVNDPKNADLIRWSDAGDSFFVIDHERFAREVLGRWFKHQNFSSFVRQLNMYGFHKIPHLQQGVLRSESDTEFWNFAHPSFHRGQPDLLCLIQRKKQTSQQQQQQQQQVQVHQQMQIQQMQQIRQMQQQQPDDVAAVVAAAAAAGLVTDGSAASGVGDPGPDSTGLTTLNHAQLLDIHSIVQGITAIKRHQAAISAELSELRRSNELLWQDALVAREKHQKQEDTINKIVKFLAGVFGKQAAGDGLGNGGHHNLNHNHNHHHHGGGPGAGGGVGGGPGGGGGGGGHHGDGDGGTGGGVPVRGMAHGGGQQGDPGMVTRRRARLMIEDGRRQSKPVKSGSIEVTQGGDDGDDDDGDEQGDANMTMTGSDAGSGGGAGAVPLSPITTLSKYRSPPSPSLHSSLDLHETGDDDTLHPFSFSSLDLSDTDTGFGYPRQPPPRPYQQQQQRQHKRTESAEYPRIEVEMEVETPKSTTTPLPGGVASPAESVNNLKDNRSLARTPPAFSSQAQQQQDIAAFLPPTGTGPNGANNGSGGAGADANIFSFDPKSLMLNLSSAQIHQLLMTLASHPLSDQALNSGNPYAGADGDYETGFLVPFEGGGGGRGGAGGAGDEGNVGGRTNSTPPFDMSSFLVASPQLADLALVPTAGNAAAGTGAAKASNGPGPTSTSNTTPSTTPVSAAPSTNTTSGDSSATPTNVPVPAGLISFDSPAPMSTATATKTTPSNPGGNGSRPTSSSGNYAGDLSVGMRGPSPFPLPWYPGAAAPTPAGAGNTPGGFTGPAVQGYTGYGMFPYSAGGGWSALPVTAAAAAGGSPTPDFNGLFTPLTQSPRMGQYPTPGSAASALAPPSPAPSNGDMTSGTVGSFNPQYNNHSREEETNANALIDSQQNLAALASNWHATEDIDRDVTALNTTIHTLMQSLGLDPELMDVNAAAGPSSPSVAEGASSGDDVSEVGPEGAEGAVDGSVMNGISGRGNPNVGGPGSPGAFDFDNLLNAWSSRGGGSGSTPSTGHDDADETNIGPSAVVNSASIPRLGNFTTSAAAATTRSGVAGGSDDTMPIRPINKKARTSLTASTPTSTGVPMTVVEPPSAGAGRKRRSTIVSSTGADGVDGAVGGVVESAQLGDPASGVQTRSGVKSKKRRG